MVLDVNSVRIATGWRVRLFQDSADDGGPAASSTVARMFIEPFPSRDERVGVEGAPCLTRASIITEGTAKASEKQCLYSEKLGF
jgi:hypothetical protein